MMKLAEMSPEDLAKARSFAPGISPREAERTGFHPPWRARRPPMRRRSPRDLLSGA